MADIKYTPSELLEQSAELSALQSEFEALFSQTTSALNGVNESWSESIARNFSGKILTAQKSFSSIANMLSNGSAAAKLGATSHSPTSIESYLGSLDAADGSASGSIRERFSLSDQDKQDLYNMLPESVKVAIKTAQNADKWLAENYEKLPESVRKFVESKLPSNVKDSVSVTHDVLAGEADAETYGKAASLVKGGSETEKSMIGSIVEAAFNPKLDANDQKARDAEAKAYNSFKYGDIGSGIQYSLEAMGYETRSELYVLGDSFTNLAGSALQNTGIPVVSDIGSALHDLL